MALEKFSKALNLQDTKATMPYNPYTELNIKTCVIPIQIAKHFVKNDDEHKLENKNESEIENEVDIDIEAKSNNSYIIYIKHEIEF